MLIEFAFPSFNSLKNEYFLYRMDPPSITLLLSEIIYFQLAKRLDKQGYT